MMPEYMHDRASSLPSAWSHAPAAGAAPVLSIVTPAYNEQDNLPVLYARLCEVLKSQRVSWEWIIIDDHSADDTFNVICSLARKDPRLRGVRFARNSGSHAALAFGLHHTAGQCAVVLAADLQDPPDTIPALLAEWRSGSHVVWAVRGHREGEKKSTLAFAGLYYWLMRNVVGMRQMPETGADFFLVDRRVAEALRGFSETNVSMIALITWMGFRQSSVVYTKNARLYGRSGWNLEKKLKLLLDSITSFTYLPIRLIAYAGAVVAMAAFLYAGLVMYLGLRGRPVDGWASLMVVVLFLGGMQMIMMGVLGEYIWRALDESRRRPRYLIEQVTPPAEQAAGA